MKTMLKTSDGSLIDSKLTNEEFKKRYVDKDQAKFEQAKFLVSQGVCNSLSHAKMIIEKTSI